MPRLLFGILPESQESLDWKKGRKRFYFEREHDVYLYYLVLESHMWDEVKDDFVWDGRGNPMMKGGWKGVAADMNSRFGTRLNELQVRARMKLLEDKPGEYFNLLFDDTMELCDQIESGRMRLLSLFQAKVSADKVEDGLVEHEVSEADGRSGD